MQGETPCVHPQPLRKAPSGNHHWKQHHLPSPPGPSRRRCSTILWQFPKSWGGAAITNSSPPHTDPDNSPGSHTSTPVPPLPNCPISNFRPPYTHILLSLPSVAILQLSPRGSLPLINHRAARLRPPPPLLRPSVSSFNTPTHSLCGCFVVDFAFIGGAGVGEVCFLLEEAELALVHDDTVEEALLHKRLSEHLVRGALPRNGGDMAVPL